jgi:hypothetical protein
MKKNNPSTSEKLSQVCSTAGDIEVKCVATGREQTEKRKTK